MSKDRRSATPKDGPSPEERNAKNGGSKDGSSKAGAQKSNAAKERAGGASGRNSTKSTVPKSGNAAKNAAPKSAKFKDRSAQSDEASDGDTFLGGLLSHFWLKLIAVLCALSLYAFIHSAQNTQRTIAVKLVAQSPPEAVKRQLLTDLPGTVDITLIGPRQQLETISPDDHSITLDLSAAQSVELRLVKSMITDLPPRVRIDRMYPAKLDIRFEDIVSRAVDVKVVLEGAPAKGMEVQGEIQLTPKDITVIGIASRVRTLQSVAADPFQVSGLGEGTHTRQLRLVAPPSYVNFSAQVVTAKLQIGKRLAQRQFDKVPISVIGLTGAKVVPAVVQIRVSGPPADVEALDADSISARVRVAVEGEDRPKSNSLELEVDVSIAGVQVEVIPNKVVVSW